MSHNLPFVLMRQLLVHDTWVALRGLVTQDLFEDTEMRKLYARIQHLHKDGESDIDPDTLRASIELVHAGKDDQQNDELQMIVDKVADQAVVDLFTARKLAQDFASRELGMRAAQLLLMGVQQEQYDPGQALDVLRSAVEAHGNSGVRSVSLFSDGALEGALDPRGGIVRLGLSAELDRILGGGVANGELFVFIAPPSRGKTSILVKCGERAASQGCRVLHVSLEISRAKVLRRYVQAIGKWGAKYLEANPDAVREAVHGAQAAWQGGEIFVTTWPPKRATVADIQGEVRRMKAGGVPLDYVIVDYAALIKPLGGRAEQRWAFGDIVQDLRAMAVEEDVKVLSAWQVNRAGAKEDEMSTTDIAEAWEVVHHADAILALNQTVEERRKNVMRLSVLKQREGQARPTAWLRCNMDKMTVRGMGEAELDSLGFAREAEHVVEAVVETPVAQTEPGDRPTEAVV